MTSRVKPGEWAVAAFCAAYTLGFSIWFLSIGNMEFVVYIITMLVLIALVGFNLRRAEFPPAMLWALALWGLLHMAGGGVPVGDSVLYSALLVPVIPEGPLQMIKYDQVVHAYGFGVSAWMLWHILARNFPVMRGSRSIYVFPALAAMGLGATNEIIEFSAVLMVEDTNVGGYYNTALDLVFNALGAILAMVIVARRQRQA